MHKRGRKLAVAIPVSVVSDIPHLREKTLEIGLIGRAMAVFRVNEIIVFSDNKAANKQKRDRNLIVTLLSYMETPQYLRKRLFKIKPELRYAGILSPLRTPHHPIEKRARKLKKGEHREGVIVAVNEKGSFVDIGVEYPFLLQDMKLSINKRVTVTITNSGKHPKIALANREGIEAYWGYKITSSRGSLGKLIESGNYDLSIATSKMGFPLKEVIDELAERWKKADRILVVFGSPSQGLQQIVAKDNVKLEQIVDYTVNTIPNQGTETVRTEEAIYASLALLNMMD